VGYTLQRCGSEERGYFGIGYHPAQLGSIPNKGTNALVPRRDITAPIFSAAFFYIQVSGSEERGYFAS
jgi:hypothetical protein